MQRIFSGKPHVAGLAHGNFNMPRLAKERRRPKPRAGPDDGKAESLLPRVLERRCPQGKEVPRLKVGKRMSNGFKVVADPNQGGSKTGLKLGFAKGPGIIGELGSSFEDGSRGSNADFRGWGQSVIR